MPLTVRVSYPPTYAQSAAAGARVVLASTERSTADTLLADAQGSVRFGRVIPGSYTLSASRALTADEAFTLTGQRTAVALAAALPARAVQAGGDTLVTLALQGSRLGNLVIKEVYYTGSRTPSGDTYFSDQFIELYNNSTDTLFLDSLYIADVFGNSGQINPTSLPTPFNTDATSVYASSIWQFPGTGRQRPLPPGRSVILAQDGINHRTDPLGNPNSPVDLSTADFESFNQRDDNRDVDAPNVPNLTRVWFTGGFDWLWTVFGPGLVVFRAPPTGFVLDTVRVPGSPALPPRVRIPNAWVIDAFEGLQNGGSGSYKRLPAALDAGFVFATGTYTSESFRRRTAATIGGRRVLQDRNNSAEDFERLSRPTPRTFDDVPRTNLAPWGLVVRRP
ncbi:MAG: DUF4876 domain-containing protein [Gemmatimonadaceae bacterium]|nr:DUF4876 domain-containing protein [Gemmatimonadaceae bacterium]